VLELLARRRAPYGELLAGIVGDVLARFPPASGGRRDSGRIVEIGAGAGQLRAWLPPDIAAHTVSTEPSPGAGAADMLRASAGALPFDAGSAAAVLGLCVFDAIVDQDAAVAEAARVLSPGGRFIHFMDMATLLETPFTKLHASNLVPIPNVFGDPGDHEWPLDIVLLARDWLDGVLAVATHAGHPLAATLNATFAPFLVPAPAFDVTAATDTFKALAASGDRRRVLAASLVTASRLAVAQGHPPVEPLPFHSARYLQSLLNKSFGAAGFDVELSDIVTRAHVRPALLPDEAGLRYRSLCVGHQRLLDAPPKRLLAPTAPPAAGADDILVEAGMFAFVARRP
jgi:SAM-dependent methyltransferase